MTATHPHESDSLYNMVMSDDEAREAYFNTTKGVLTVGQTMTTCKGLGLGSMSPVSLTSTILIPCVPGRCS